jgi:hypothetical protein
MPYNGTFDPIDAISAGRPGIDHTQTTIHAGKSYHAQVNGTLAAASTISLLVTVPATGTYHAVFKIKCNTSATAGLYESPTLCAGSTITVYNRNRNSTNTSSMTVKSDPTVATTGSIILDLYTIGSSETTVSEVNGKGWCLQNSATYLYKVMAVGGSNIITASVDWYEG